jgi:hypothetical protein
MSKRNNILGHWYFNELVGHKGPIPNPNAGRFFMKNLMNIAAADGVISDRERQWVIGFATACGKYIRSIHQINSYFI